MWSASGAAMKGPVRSWWTSTRDDRSPVVESSPARTVVAPVQWLCAITDIGASRSVNEDAFGVSRDCRLWVVADGMGGQKRGGLASQISVDAVIESMTAPMEGTAAAAACRPGGRLRRALCAAHARVLSRSTSDESCRGMGSAVVAGYVTGDVVHIGHAGDARAYLFRATELMRLTIDHSAVAAAVLRHRLTWEQARSHPDRSKLRQAIGVTSPFEPEFVSIPLRPNDTLMLCSDGVWALQSDREIARLMRSELSVHQMGAILVNRVLAAGGDDNITLVIYRHLHGSNAEQAGRRTLS